MPIRKVHGGYKFGKVGKVYRTKKKAEKQMRAMYAHGLTEETKNLPTFSRCISESQESVILQLNNKKLEIKLENEVFRGNELIKPSELDYILKDGWRLPTVEEMQEMIDKYEWECYEPNAVMYLNNESEDEIYWNTIESGRFEYYGIYLIDSSKSYNSRNYTWFVFADGVDPCLSPRCDRKYLPDLGDFPCLVRLVRDVK